MANTSEIIGISPKFAIPRGEILIDCENFPASATGDQAVHFDDVEGRILAASSRRVIASVPEGLNSTNVSVSLSSYGGRTNGVELIVGRKLADEMHIVANPAIDPKDDSLIVTRSGSRGQKLSTTLFRIDTDGFVSDIMADVMNPTGIAFDARGRFFVTNRAAGEVCQVVRDEDVMTFASGLGTATGIAFDRNGTMFVGDRAGTIHRISDQGNPEPFATVEPSVAAYHLAFGNDDRLFVTAPGLSSFDSVYAIGPDGFDTKFFKGLGRPQGLAFDTEGNLFVAACYQGRRGIVRIPPGGDEAELCVAGNNVVGLCFTRKGELIVATNDSVFSIPFGQKGMLLG